MKMGVATYSFDVLRLMLEYILGESSFVQPFDCYLNVLAVETLVSQCFFTIKVNRNHHSSQNCACY